MQYTDYRIELRPLSADEGGGYLAAIPDLPGCMADGETPQEALDDLAGAYGAWVATAREAGREVPQPGAQAKPIAALVRWPRTLHAQLTAAAAAEGMSFNAFVITTCAAAVARREVERRSFVQVRDAPRGPRKRA
jgi:antitoxin HicB